jgi:hypothetical protein
LAERVLEDREHGHGLVRYEELVADPQGTLARLLEGLPAGALGDRCLAPRVRNRRSVLDAEDMEAITTICAPAASELGVAWQ